MGLWFLLCILVSLYNSADAAPGIRQRSATNGTSSTILTPKFVDTVQQIVDEEGIPGLTLAIVYQNGSSELGAWGIKSENGTTMTTDTLFNLASCSKAFLSASLGILIDDFANGRNSTPLPVGLSTLSWKTKLADILPNEWKLEDDWASEKANLIDILTHVSGLSRHDFSYKSHESVHDITRNLRNLRPSVELREQWLYNNQMYMVGANVVSTLSGMRLADFVSSRIFKPLGMSSSTYSIDAAIRTGRFTNTWTSFGRLIPPWLHEEYVDLMAGPAGVISSVEDLVPWIRMFLNGGIDPDTNATIIPPTEFEVITSPHSIVSPDTSGQPGFSTELYGLGWGRLSLLGHDVITHTGGAPGVSTVVAAAIEDGIGVIVLANARSSLSNIILTTTEMALGSRSSSFSTPTNQSTPSTDLSRRAHVTPRADSTAPPPYLDLAGAYFNAGYGIWVLCSTQSLSSSCQSVLDDFRSVEKTLNSTDLFASWITPWSAHIRFSHTNNSEYLISSGTIYPEGYGKNSKPFSTLGPIGLATFVLENEKVVGFGIRDISGVERAGPVEKTSGVWFVKQA